MLRDAWSALGETDISRCRPVVARGVPVADVGDPEPEQGVARARQVYRLGQYAVDSSLNVAFHKHGMGAGRPGNQGYAVRLVRSKGVSQLLT